ncbi:uncharacterized protein N0V89_001273 [Didymosphaeria variabile]|uniref:Glycogen debranching enzyme n=1 Tax=Didymosphaeria variabile TaxID=1932322 RepID=A0A9W8XWQ2_9PLEO|nr:uncharacterized protein N0V89_001273 [Didymosphaeria variabile]KAJ4360706.1 hypothetical protein N0V89_001273 [Didymosphaeria variabile]
MATLFVLWYLLAASFGFTFAADCPASRLHISEPPYDNYFLSDCITSAHVIVTSPDANTNNSNSKPRLLVAWPAGNSGATAYFEAENNGTLGLQLQNSTADGQILDTVNQPAATGAKNQNPRVGVKGLVHFDTPALLTLPILGSIRSIRDYSEGGGILSPDVQNAVVTETFGDNGGQFSRTWFDGETTTWIDFTPTSGVEAVQIITGDKWMLRFGTGTYEFRATFNYPQLVQLSPSEVLNNASQALVRESADLTKSLSFLSYSNKLLAGSWRFLTYFGRDSMLSALLMQDILSQGEGGALEAVIGAVIERINKTDGTVCHEENLGDYAAFLARQDGIDSSAPSCDYKMIDTDFLFPILMNNYFVNTDVGKDRAALFFSRKATFLEENAGTAYSTLAERTAERIMSITAPFVSSQVASNLLHLKDGQTVGNWRDSGTGLGGGRIPYDVNTALVPAGLRAIASLSQAGYFSDHPDWADTAAKYAQVWEDETLQFFEVSVSSSEAKQLVQQYVSDAALAGPSNTDQISGNITFYGLALGTDDKPVRVMNTDDCFRHFLLNTTNQAQLSAFLEQTADHILQNFPVGLKTDVGLFVANPAYADSRSLQDQFKNSDYHGTVVWSWQLAMMAAGLGRQLARCNCTSAPDFCGQKLRSKVGNAYEVLWETINENRAQLSGEVWSWQYNNGYQPVPLSAFSTTESDIIQLWSLTFLAVHQQDV